MLFLVAGLSFVEFTRWFMASFTSPHRGRRSHRKGMVETTHGMVEGDPMEKILRTSGA